MQEWVSTDGEVEIEFYLPCFKEDCNAKAQVKVHWTPCKCSETGATMLYCLPHFERHMFSRGYESMFPEHKARCRECHAYVTVISYRGMDS